MTYREWDVDPTTVTGGRDTQCIVKRSGRARFVPLTVEPIRQRYGSEHRVHQRREDGGCTRTMAWDRAG